VLFAADFRSKKPQPNQWPTFAASMLKFAALIAASDRGRALIRRGRANALILPAVDQALAQEGPPVVRARYGKESRHSNQNGRRPE
jgi:hypothetical protein